MFLPTQTARAFSVYCVCCQGTARSFAAASSSCSSLPSVAATDLATDLPFDTHSHLHTASEDLLESFPPSNFQSLCLRSSAELIERAGTSNSKHVISIGLHPWNVEPSLTDPQALKTEAGQLIQRARVNGNLVMVGETGLDFAMLKNLKPAEKDLHKQAQLSALTALATLGPPLSLHCVRADQDLRQCLSSSFLSCDSPPKFIVLHGSNFKDVGGWLSWERKLRVDVRVMFGVCSRHVSTKADLQVLLAKNSDLSSRLLLESDGMDPSTWEEEMRNGIRLVDGVSWTDNWNWCLEILESERDNGKIR
ncbi:hypothetical protein TrVE_jg14438 [Triparma verrucosa]|uniref:Uncharacterized protein n=1 Tax=Triparma verrucosa TaxID=1606542 RepID=A0A9W7BYL8_9STRA|nr:hypothetical protein TrVE_jg14438 [Triparma verrucosa]